MRKELSIMYNLDDIIYKIPIVFAEEYDRQINLFGFSNKTEVLAYLSIGLYNKQNGLRNSNTVRGILDRISVERPGALRSFPRVSRRIVIKEDCTTKIFSISGFGSQSNLMNAIVEAFLESGRTEKRRLRREMHAGFVRDITVPDMLQTYVSNSQYDRLFDMSVRGGMSFTDVVRSAINIAIASENPQSDSFPVPFEVQEAMQDRLRIEGFTSHRFSRETQVHVRVFDEEQRDGIRQLIRRYEIPGSGEFIRRILLFLLSSKEIGFRYVPDDESNSEECDYFDENEMYYNDRLSRKDFVRGIYQ